MIRGDRLAFFRQCRTKTSVRLQATRRFQTAEFQLQNQELRHCTIRVRGMSRRTNRFGRINRPSLRARVLDDRQSDKLIPVQADVGIPAALPERSLSAERSGSGTVLPYHSSGKAAVTLRVRSNARCQPFMRTCVWPNQGRPTSSGQLPKTSRAQTTGERIVSIFAS